MADDNQESGRSDAPPARSPSVVKQRVVTSRTITRKEQAERSGAPVDAAAQNPNAPKPQANLEKRIQVVQLRQRHKEAKPRGKPANMSDIKL